MLLALTPLPTQAADASKEAIFAAQAKSLAEMNTVAEGLVHCGIRPGDWAQRVETVVWLRIRKIAAALWPPDNGLGVYYINVGNATVWLRDASTLGTHVSPEWCVEMSGSPVLRKLDEAVGG
jgi:hypothetical protein